MFRNPQSFQILIFLILFIVCPTSLRANILNEQNPLDRILDQQKLEQQKEKLLEKPEISETKDIKRKYKRTSPNCVEVEKVEFSKADKLTQKARSALSEEVLGKCVFNDQIGEFLGNITNYYIKKGYTNARPYFQAYDLESKTLKIMVLEGIIEQIRLQTINPDGNNNKVSEQSHASKFLEKAQIFFAFPTKAGDIFKIADIEQGVDNMNRLRSNNAVIDSRPSTAVGESEVIVNNYKKLNSWEVGIGYANSGSKSTGIYNTTYRINKDNLFCVNDNIGFTQTKSEGSETNMFNISIPFGYYRFSYTNSYNHYTSKAGVSFVEGTSYNNDFNLSRLLYRSKASEINIKTTLNFRDQNREVNRLTEIGSQRLSTGRIGFDFKTRFKNGISIYSGITYSKGLKIHGAIDDKEKGFLEKDAVRAQFEKFSYNFSLYSALGKYLNYSMQINGQHSADSLYSSELIFVGGSEYSVRGLSHDGIGGSKGGYVRNDLSLNVAAVVDKISEKSAKSTPSNSKSFTQKIKQELKNVQPFIFYDSGFTREIVRSDENQETQYISGAGVGVKYYGEYVNAELTYATSLRQPDYVLRNNDYQNSSIYFGISGKYQF